MFGRRKMQARVGCVVLLLSLAGIAEARAQQDTCGPSQASGSISFTPVMEGSFASPTLLAPLKAGFIALTSRTARGQAEPTFQKALAASVEAKNRCAEGLAAFGIAMAVKGSSLRDSLKWLGQAETAFKAIDAPLGLGRTHVQLAKLHLYVGMPDQATLDNGMASTELDKAGDHIAALSARIDMVPEAVGYAPKYAALLEQAKAVNATCLEADILEGWGYYDHQFLDYDAAMKRLEAADRLYARCPGSAESHAQLQRFMGKVELEHGRLAATRAHYRIAVSLTKLSIDPGNLPQALDTLGVAYRDLGDNAKALALFRQGLAKAEENHAQALADLIRANMGGTYLSSNRPDLAVPLLEAASKNVTQDYTICTRIGQLADAHDGVGNYEASLKDTNRALPACEKRNAKDQLTGLLRLRANAEVHLGQLDAASADSHRALALVEELRAHLVQQDAYKQGYITRTRSIYDQAIDILMRQHRYDEALETSEQARARAFLDLLGSQRAEGKSVPSGKAAETYRTSLIQSHEHTPALTAAQMMDEATRLHSTLLAYWLSDTNLYTWVARPGQPVTGVTQAVKPELLAHLVRATRPNSGAETSGTLATRGGGRVAVATANGSAQWRQLYSILIVPVQSQLPQEKDALLTIVPSGPLFQLSFAALMDERGGYLIEHYKMHTIPTVGLLQFTQLNQTTSAKMDAHYLFVADPEHLPAGSNGKPLPKLPGTAVEVRSIARMLPAGEVKLLEGSQAREGLLVAEIPRATVLHFATHAVVDDAFPEKTFLALDTGQQQGRLMLGEVYGLNLHTRLVVLSACRTGLGKVTGDGVMGLSRAFFYAGSASVLTTLWDVADQPTAAMLPRFYRALQGGQTASDSLRTAQIEMLQDLRHGRIRVKTLKSDIALPPDPAYWAAFTLSGEP